MAGAETGELARSPALPRPGLLGWVRHEIRLVPRAAELEAVPVLGFLPERPCLATIGARSPGWATLQLFCATEDGRRELIHEFAVPGGERRVQHLVAIPKGSTALFLRAAPGGGRASVRSMSLLELSSKGMTAFLAVKWAARQLRHPRRLPEKIANAIEAVRRGGLRAVAQGAVESQVAHQSAEPGSTEAGTDAAPADGHPLWEGASFVPRHTTKEGFAASQRRRLLSFLAEDGTIEVPATGEPLVTIVVVTFNRAELVLGCLQNLAAHAPPSSEVVVVDNASSDETREVLRRVRGAVVIENDENVGFLRACNQAVDRASAEHVLLLNSDAMVLPGAIDAALETLRGDSDVGVVGGTLVGLDGILQEAGSIVWRGGTCEGYGRGDDPGRPEYRFRRDVDFVSGAFLLTRRVLWDKLGGFDDAYAPAYYEDVDYCVRGQREGYRVVYEPGAGVVHYEYGSSPGADSAVAAMKRNRSTFVERHGQGLGDRPSPSRENVLQVRTPGSRRRVLVMDDRVPLSVMGSGSPRMTAIVRGLVILGNEVTFFPGLPFIGTWDEVYAEIPREVEVMLGWDRRALRRFLDERRGHYSDVMVSRAHNMALVNELLAQDPSVLGGASLIYDAEAIGAMRDVTAPAVRGRALSPEKARRLVRAEVAVAATADRVASVSPMEAKAFSEAGVSEVEVLSHAVEPRPTPRPFAERANFLFVGRLSEHGSPNSDGVRWFLDDVWPLVRRALAEAEPELLVAGKASPTLLSRRDPGVRFLGPVDDLTPLYDAARVFVAPLRFSAGIPLKILEAASFGVPVVTTDLLCRQLGWEAGHDLLCSAVGDIDAFARNCATLYGERGLWERTRQKASDRIERTATMDRFVESLEKLFPPADAPEGRG